MPATAGSTASASGSAAPTTGCGRGVDTWRRRGRRTDVDDRGTCLWTMRRENRQVACLVRLVPHGIEVEIAHDGAAIATRVFDTGEEALQWSEQTRADRRARGWQDEASAAEHADSAN